MKKSTKGSKSKKSAAPKAAAKKPAPKRQDAPAAAPPARPTEGRYTPPPLRTDGWAPFRYPPQ